MMFNEQTAVRRLSRITALCGLAASLIGPRMAAAQTRSLTVIEPSEWRFKDTLFLGDRRVLRIRGSASDSSGVTQVLVNGRPAALMKDPQNPKFWLFDMTIPADSVPARTILKLVPGKGAQ